LKNPALNPLEKYLRELRNIRRSGSALETSCYPALRDLMDAVGSTVKPRVKCIIHVSHGAGIPDGREREILGRGLTINEIHAVTAIARRIAALLLLEPTLDANYETITASPYLWRARVRNT